MVIKTKNGNIYHYNQYLKQVSLINLELGYLLTLNDENVKIIYEKIKKSKKQKVILGDLGEFDQDELLLQISKYMFLKKHDYFGTKNNNTKLFSKFTCETIEKNLANITNICFEVTDNCNLSCVYCAYSKYYKGYDQRGNKKMDKLIVKNTLDYVSSLWSENLTYPKSEFVIGFYGGEPLLNFDLIQWTVNYVKNNLCTDRKIIYNMTTNATLLDKYMDFLVENNFDLLISLDGDEINNTNRKSKNNSKSFDKVFNNVKKIRHTYPDYFNNNVSFNAVLNSSNSIEDILGFYKTNFDKRPKISEVSTIGLNPDNSAEFKYIYKSIQKNLEDSNDFDFIMSEYPTINHRRNELLEFLKRFGYLYATNYSEILNYDSDNYFVPTGTCFPFQYKCFITVSGKILPCNNVSHDLVLGIVNKKGVNIDYKIVAEKYKNYYKKINYICSKCYNLYYCRECIFISDFNTKHSCRKFRDVKSFNNYLRKKLTLFEDKPELLNIFERNDE